MESRGKLLPFDEGGEAYVKRILTDANPYPEGTWQHNEWWDGWKNANEADSRDAYDWIADRFKDDTEQPTASNMC